MNADQAAVALLGALRDRGMSVREAPPLSLESTHRPWFVSLMLGFAGWLAGFFLLLFIEVVFDVDSSLGWFGLGAALLVFAWAMYFADRNAVFLDQLALAISIAGQFAVAWALLEQVHSEVVVCATLLGIQLAVFAVMPNKAARALATFFAAIAWIYLLRFVIRQGHAGDFFFDAEDRHGPDAARAILAWLFTWPPMLALGWWLTWREHQWMSTPLRTFARPALTGVLMAMAIGPAVTEPFAWVFFGPQSVGMQLGWVAVFPLLSIGIAMFAACCGFRLRSHGLTGFAIFAALLHVSRFYYNFGTSLTWKALIMAFTGAALLGAGLALQRRAREALP